MCQSRESKWPGSNGWRGAFVITCGGRAGALPTPASPATLSSGRLNISVCLIGGVIEEFKWETEAMANGDFTKKLFQALWLSPAVGPHTEGRHKKKKWPLMCSLSIMVTLIGEMTFRN